MAGVHKYSHRHAFKAKDSPNNYKCKHTQMCVLISCFQIHVETHKLHEFIDGYLKTHSNTQRHTQIYRKHTGVHISMDDKIKRAKQREKGKLDFPYSLQVLKNTGGRIIGQSIPKIKVRKRGQRKVVANGYYSLLQQKIKNQVTNFATFYVLS